MPPSNTSRSPASTKKTGPACSPVAKLLGNRPTVGQSLLSTVEALSFDAIPHQEHQPTLPDQTSRTRPSSFQSLSPQRSPPISLTASPNLNGSSPRWDEPARETPTIRHLKTSLRSRLQSDSDRHQKRFSEDSGKSTDSAENFLHQQQSPRASPHKPTPASLQASHRESDWPAHIRSATSSSSAHRLAFTSEELSPPPPPPKELASSDERSSSTQAHSQDSLPINLLLSTHNDTRAGSQAGLSANHHESCDATFGTTPTPPSVQSPHSTGRPAPAANLPDLRIPLINVHLSPPALAQWSVEAYESTGETQFADIIAHLAMLPLHTLLAIANKLPAAGRYLALNPLLHQAEQDKQGILLTASQLAIGLSLASGWKVARRFLR